MAASYSFLVLLALSAAVCVLSETDGSWTPPKFCNGLDCPRYTVIQTTKDYELRKYETSKWVHTSMSGVVHPLARRVMFFRLFDYISGENEPGKKVAMTAPVLTKVLTEEENNNFTMAFYVAPSEAVNAPKPTNPDVALGDLCALTVYAKSFGGYAELEDYVRAGNELLQSLPKDAKINRSYFYMAGYDSPYKPFDRHNEVWAISL